MAVLTARTDIHATVHLVTESQLDTVLPLMAKLLNRFEVVRSDGPRVEFQLSGSHGEVHQQLLAINAALEALWGAAGTERGDMDSTSSPEPD